ncbi:MAG: BspA family leucine-rich repeat surface protein, partial [Firmicutes bacterium]|nr:BspA family leucine-rich repeat surface protein [Bacillota bacterium]
NTSKVTDMNFMFWYCENLVELDVNSWDTSNVTGMAGTFDECTNLKELNISNWNTSKVTHMECMFDRCKSLVELDLNSWDTSNVTGMASTFEECINLKKLNVSNWNIANTGIGHMFCKCPNLRYLDLNGWNLNENNKSLSLLFDVEENTPLLIRTRDNVLQNYDYNNDERTFFTTTLKVDGDFAKFKIDPDEENVSYSDDKKTKYIIIYPTYTTTDSEEEIMNKLKNRLIEERDKIEFKNGQKMDWVPEENYNYVSDALGGTYMIGAKKYSATLKVDGRIAKFKENNNFLEPGNYNSDRTEKYISIYVMLEEGTDKKIVWTKLKKILEDEKENLEIDKNYAFVKWNPEINESQEPNQSLGTYVVKTKGYLIEDVNFSWPQLKSGINVGESISIKDLFCITDSPNIPAGCKLIYKIGDGEGAYWVEYAPNDKLVFDQAGELKIYLKIDGGENYFDKEYEKNGRNYLILRIGNKDAEDIGNKDAEDDESDNGTGIFHWDTISDGKVSLRSIGLPNRLKTAKYLEGYSEGNRIMIKPNNNVKRGEFANMIYKLMHDEKEKVNTDVLKNLNDVKSSDWYGSSVAYVLDKKIFDTGKNFRPNENVTRGEVAEVVYNVIKFYDATKTKEYTPGKYYYNFTDLSGPVSDIIKQLASHGIVNGYEDKTFKQNNNITRAEVTKIIFTAFERKNNPGKQKYSDLDNKHWAYNFLMDASE